MNTLNRTIIIASLFLSSLLFAQEGGIGTNSTKLLAYDLQPVKADVSEITPFLVPEETVTSEKKSPILAGLLSLVIPGAGQVYNGDYWKAGLFLGAEAGMIITALAYEKKGDDKTVEFEAYADKNWDMVKYTEWILKYKTELGLPDSASVTINPNTALAPWERVDRDQLNYWEGKIFSHRIYPHGHQQYYEMIGKYLQFTYGWSDTEPASVERNSPKPGSQFDVYRNMRGEANDYYAVTSTMIKLILVNHLVSVVDAIISTVLDNKAIDISLRSGVINTGSKIEPTGSIQLAVGF